MTREGWEGLHSFMAIPKVEPEGENGGIESLMHLTSEQPVELLEGHNGILVYSKEPVPMYSNNRYFYKGFAKLKPKIPKNCIELNPPTQPLY